MEYLGLSWSVEIEERFSYSDITITNKLLDAQYKSSDLFIRKSDKIKAIYFKDSDYSKLYINYTSSNHNHTHFLLAYPVTELIQTRKLLDSLDDNKSTEDLLELTIKQLYYTAVKLQCTRIEHYLYKQKIEKEMLTLRAILTDLQSGLQDVDKIAD